MCCCCHNSVLCKKKIKKKFFFRRKNVMFQDFIKSALTCFANNFGNVPTNQCVTHQNIILLLYYLLPFSLRDIFVGLLEYLYCTVHNSHLSKIYKIRNTTPQRDSCSKGLPLLKCSNLMCCSHAYWDLCEFVHQGKNNFFFFLQKCYVSRFGDRKVLR